MINNLTFKNLTKYLKKETGLLLESEKDILSIRGSKYGKTVLLIGDGVSSIYMLPNISQYDDIICCNLSVLNKEIISQNLTNYVNMDARALIPKFGMEGELYHALNTALRKNSNLKMVMHAIGRLFNFMQFRYEDVLYISPYHSIEEKKSKVYTDFSGSFQACLGIALLSGFSEIHMAGFDAWLLSPKNNLRWYSGCNKPDEMDYYPEIITPDFLVKASNYANFKVYTFRHYTSRFNFIKEIRSNNMGIYIPEQHRKLYFNEKDLTMWKNREGHLYPKGYSVEEFS